MSSKPHPLDIFRSSEQGFDAASRAPRKRRTVSGKVVRSVARADAARAPAPAPRSSKSSAPSRGRAARPAARTGARRATPRKTPQLVSNRILLWTAVLVVGALGAWLVFGPDAAPDVPTLKAPGGELESLFSARAQPEAATPEPPAAAAAAPESRRAPPPDADFTILAATYVGSAVSTAQVAATELSQRGFAGVELVGFPGEDGNYERVELIVGRHGDRNALTSELVRLRSITDWGTGREASPFHDARLVPHPLSDG